MKRKQGICLLSLVLCLAILVGIMPTMAFSVQKNAFVLVAEADGQLVIAPEYVQYSAGQTIAQALAASGHKFQGLEEGMVTAIDGVVGEYTRSDEAGDYALYKEASQIRFYRFSEDSAENCRPSAGLQRLMTAMADYVQESADVQAAAKAAYTNACAQLVGASSETANTLAQQLEQAVKAYQDSLAGTKYTVTFQTADGASVCAENPYGRVWMAEKNAKTLALPKGSYTFRVEKDGLRVEGEITVARNMQVAAELCGDQWLTDFRLSGSYGAAGNENGQFTDDEFALGQWNNREITVPVADTFVGTVYAYAQVDEALLSVPKLTAISTGASSQVETKRDIPLASWISGVPDVLGQGTAGNQVVFRLCMQKADGYRYSQDYRVNFTRVPTISAITLTDQTDMDQVATEKFDGRKTSYVYKVTDEVTSVKVKAAGFSPDYEILVNGRANGSEIQLNRDASGKTIETEIVVTVKGNGYKNAYRLTIQPGEGKSASFRTEAGVTLEVVNENGIVLPYKLAKESSTGAWQYKYVLVDGMTYRYVATKNTYYHAADEFVLNDLSSGTLTRINVPTEPWLTSLDFGTNSGSKYRGSLALDQPFAAEVHAYDVNLVDTANQVYTWVDAIPDVTVEARYTQLFTSDLYHGKALSLPLTAGKTTGTMLKRFLMQGNPWENTVVIRLQKDEDGVTLYQEYPVNFTRSLTLEQIEVSCDGKTAFLEQLESGKVGFASGVNTYRITVPLAAKALSLTASAYTDNRCYGETSVGYEIFVDNEPLSGGQVEIPLSGSMETQTVTVRVENAKAPQGSREYTIHVLKSPPVFAAITVQPENAVLMLYQQNTGERIHPNAEGAYLLSEGFRYAYALTQYGYRAKSGVLEVTRDGAQALVVTDGDVSYQAVPDGNGGGTVKLAWSLQKAPANQTLVPDLPAEWPDFRGSSTNNGVTSAPIPTAAEEGTLYWAKQLGKGFDSDAVGSPILVDGDIVTYAGNQLYRVDPINGEIKASAEMDHKSSFSITPPVYAEGMIFVALSNGTVQAFHAETLESLWLFQDPLGGQPNCPITVKNGYLYTGFWNSENKKANFVCLSITDEDPAQQKESKTASWAYTQLGGFYWAGAYVGEEYLLVGTDDGFSGYTSQTSQLLLLDPRDGTVLDAWENLNADVRSTIVYDAQTDAYYFTSKGGSFYSTQVVETAEGWKFANQWQLALENGTGGVPMSTCSPVVYRGRAYVGVSGSGQFTAYSGHNITVIDLARKRIAYRVETQGYPQTSGLLTTAYEQRTGYVYVYFFDNMTPGKLRVLRDRPGQTRADFLTVENGHSTAYALFTPTGEQAQYAICSPIADEYGTIYFKNDSARLMAFGSKIVELTVTKEPEKLSYAPGEAFDPTGMVVTATYANGKTRDVTAYVSFKTEALTEEDATLTISFPHVLYHNTENGTGMVSGTKAETPTATLELTITEETEPKYDLGDVNGDGELTYADAQFIAYYIQGVRLLSDAALDAADVNGDDDITYADAQLIAYLLRGAISSFPRETAGGRR